MWCLFSKQWFKLGRKKICLFLDADGILWPDQGSGTILKLPDIAETAQILINDFASKKNHVVIIVSNQTAAARNMVELTMFRRLLNRFFMDASSDLNITAVYVCFHHPDAVNLNLRSECPCRKPKSGMIIAARKKFNLSLMNSYLVGDRITDIMAAHRGSVPKAYLLMGPNMFELNIHEKNFQARQKKSIVFLPINDLSEVQTRMKADS